MDIPIVETKRLILRPFSEADIETWADTIFGDPAVTRYLPPTSITSRERTERLFHYFLDHWMTRGFGEWAVTSRTDGRFIGQCGLNHLEETDEIEIDYALAQPYWGRGIATEAARASIEFGIDVIGIDQIIGLVMPENIASCKVLEHLGFAYDREDEYFGVTVAHYTLTPERFRSRK